MKLTPPFRQGKFSVVIALSTIFTLPFSVDRLGKLTKVQPGAEIL